MLTVPGKDQILGATILGDGAVDDQGQRIDRLVGGQSGSTLEAVVAFEEALETLQPVVATLDQVVGDLDQIANRDAHLGKPLNLQQSGEDFLGDVFGTVWGQRATAEAVDAVIVLLKKIKNDVGMG